MSRRPAPIHVHAGGGASAGARDRIAALLAEHGRRSVRVDAAELDQVLPEIELLLCYDIPRSVDWSRATSLRLVQVMGSGTDGLWPVTGLPPAVAIANARGIHLPEMRDHALALMLAFERGLPRLWRDQAQREWRPVATGSLSGKTAGILGLGEVGRSLATACAALGMRVVGTRRRPQPTPGVEEVHGEADVDRVLDVADHLIVTLPRTSATRGLLSARALSRLRASAVLVVLSRGGIVDDVALDAALRANRLRGAALDVFDEEPLPSSSPLWDTPNLLITPHVAGLVPDYLERAVSLFLENVDLVERGLVPRTAVDREHEY